MGRDDLRERVARIVAPEAFADDMPPLAAASWQDRALQKADAIPALVEPEIRADERAKTRRSALSDEAVERAARAYLRSLDIDPDRPRDLALSTLAWWQDEAPHIRAAISAALGGET